MIDHDNPILVGSLDRVGSFVELPWFSHLVSSVMLTGQAAFVLRLPLKRGTCTLGQGSLPIYVIDMA